MRRPYPPADMLEDPNPRFVPAPELETWARQQFINEISPLHNPEHVHLQMANLGFVWTNAPNSRGGRVIAGTCELMPPMAMGKWARARAEAQMREWFGDMPDFLITISAPHAQAFDDASFMALVEHELYHAGQDKDEFGQPKFSKSSGLPIFALRAHDVEEFNGIVRRYGAAAAGVEEMVRAANKGPEIGEAQIARACGTCGGLRLVKG